MKILIEEGAVNSSNIGDLRVAPFGEAILLTGQKGDYVLVDAQHPIGFFRARLDAFRHYVKVSTTEKAHSETLRVPGIDGMQFVVRVEMSARLEDPTTFLKLYGPHSSLLSPFYSRSIEDVQRELARFSQSEVQAANSQMELLAKKIGSRRPVFDGVEVISFGISVAPDPEQQRKEKVGEIYHVFDRMGAKGLAGMKAMYPEMAKTIDTFYDDLQKFRTGELRADHEEFRLMLERAKDMREAGVIESDEMDEFLRIAEYKTQARVQSGRETGPSSIKAPDRQGGRLSDHRADD